MKGNITALLGITAALMGGATVLPGAAQTLNHPEVYMSRHDISRPLRDIQPSANLQGRTPEVDDDQNAAPVAISGASKQILESRQSAKTTSSQSGTTPKAQTTTAISSSTTVGLNFDGVGDIVGYPVSDSNGSVGATQYVQWVNSQYAVFNKSTGAMVLGPNAGNTLWSGFGGPCETRNDGDPIAQYDKASARWVMTKHATPTSGPFYQCVAISTTSDATGTYFRYAFSLPDYFPDYPKLGVWPDAYYLTWNLLNQNSSYTFVNPLVCAFDRNSMLSGAAATSLCFEVSSSYIYLLPSDWDGANPPPSGSPNYFMSLGTNSINIWQFHVDFGTPSNSTFTGPTTLAVNSFVQACPGGANLGLCVPQEGTSQDVDSLHDRLMYRLAYRNFVNGPESVVATNSEGNPTGINWYEIRNPGGSPFIWQQGTFAPDTSYRWTPSIAMDQSGDIALGYSVSSSKVYPSVRYTGRLSSDPLGSMETEATILQGTASQSGLSRWGDYSSMSIDPVDDCTFWYTNQYILSNNNWQTRIANFKFSNCTSAPPATLSSTNPFGSQQVGTTSSGQVVTLANNQSVPLNISSIATTGDFAQTNNCGASIPATSTCQITVTFTPTTAGTRNGSLVVTDDAPNSPQSTDLTGTGTGPIASLSLSSLSFSYQVVGKTSAAKSVTLTNTGNTALTVNSVNVSGNFGETDNCAGNQVQPSNSCTIQVTFGPSSAASFSGILTINDSAGGSPQWVSLSGLGLRPVSLTPVSMAFGTVNVGQTSTQQTATVTNNQSAALNLSFSASGNFSAVGSGSNPCGSTMAANGSCTISVSFAPTTNGSISGSLTLAHNALFSPQVVDLSGTGASGSTPPLTFSPTSLSFTKVAVGTTTSKTLTVTNSSGASINISSVSASGNFSLSPTSPCVGALTAGANCKFTVTFGPTNIGTVDGSVTVNDNAAVSQQTLSITGTTVLPVTLSTPSSFGSQSVGTVSSAQVITLTNNESSTLSISNISVSGDYIRVSAGGSPCGSTVAALAQCTIGVEFAPTVTGSIPGVLTVSYSGFGSPQEVSLTGTGD